MFYGQQVGFDQLLDRLQSLEKQHGEAFAPAALLERMAAEGKGYRELGY